MDLTYSSAIQQLDEPRCFEDRNWERPCTTRALWSWALVVSSRLWQTWVLHAFGENHWIWRNSFSSYPPDIRLYPPITSSDIWNHKIWRYWVISSSKRGWEILYEWRFWLEQHAWGGIFRAQLRASLFSDKPMYWALKLSKLCGHLTNTLLESIQVAWFLGFFGLFMVSD